jgi:hypothetical protein
MTRVVSSRWLSGAGVGVGSNAAGSAPEQPAASTSASKIEGKIQIRFIKQTLLKPFIPAVSAGESLNRSIIINQQLSLGIELKMGRGRALKNAERKRIGFMA